MQLFVIFMAVWGLVSVALFAGTRSSIPYMRKDMKPVFMALPVIFVVFSALAEHFGLGRSVQVMGAYPFSPVGRSILFFLCSAAFLSFRRDAPGRRDLPWWSPFVLAQITVSLAHCLVIFFGLFLVALSIAVR